MSEGVWKEHDSEKFREDFRVALEKKENEFLSWSKENDARDSKENEVVYWKYKYDMLWLTMTLEKSLLYKRIRNLKEENEKI